MAKRVYVWEVPVRLTHWLSVLSILALSVTGLYIGAPYIFALNENQLIMAKMRYFHFIASYIYTVCMFVRVYWLFAGNQYARWDQFIPVTRERRENIAGTTSFYCFLREKCPQVIGHTGLAGLAYVVLAVITIVEILTGFALYSQSHPAGGIWTLMGGWLFAVMSEGTVRLVHHLLTWAIVVFMILHVYITAHNTLIEKSGLFGSIFNGYKSIEE